MQPETPIDHSILKECESRIAEIYARCNAEQPNFGISEVTFSASIQRTASKYLLAASAEPVTTKELKDLVDQIQAEDLFMALACSSGNERAWWEFDQQHRGYMERVARHLAKTETDASEVIDSVYVELYGTRVVDGERISKFASISTAPGTTKFRSTR
jgi:hypothetical protein